MIRFIWLGAQITEGAEDFAFFDTVRDRFMRFSGEEVFVDLEDFRACSTNKAIEARCVELYKFNHPKGYIRPERLPNQYWHTPEKDPEE
jgi:hypothetical protein